MIHFNEPPYTGKEFIYMQQTVKNAHICGDGEFTRKCHAWLEQRMNSPKVLLTTSCTHALEMSALLIDIQPGDEVIMPSYTFASTADAFVMRGAKIVFVDIRPDTMNMDENLIEAAVTKRTKAICVMHYAGVSCEMDKILSIAAKYNLKVVEDAAQAVMSKYKGVSLGSIGDYGCYSFHETKNYSMGEGGALLIQDKEKAEKAEIIREKGTDRSKFWRGEVDKYTWVDFGSSYLPSDLNAAFLWAQLEQADEINDKRLRLWNLYRENLQELMDEGNIDLPFIPKDCVHNAHMFYIKTKDMEERGRLIQYLKENEIAAVFHYIPLHSVKAGKKFGIFSGEDNYTTKESERLLRLPLHYHVSEDDVNYVSEKVREFYK